MSGQRDLGRPPPDTRRDSEMLEPDLVAATSWALPPTHPTGTTLCPLCAGQPSGFCALTTRPFSGTELSFKLCSAPKLKMSFCCRLTDIAPESSELVLSPCQWKSLQEVREGDLLLLCGPGREAEHCGNTVDGQPDPGAEQIPARSTKSKTVVLESKVLPSQSEFDWRSYDTDLSD
ncbi:hypothetical protein MJT46_005741 [Ovis ammon polii x Ovis aries]|nr:hypothetical protein MJT46_005741 [Ovis ammon polii x Ovis aries]